MFVCRRIGHDIARQQAVHGPGEGMLADGGHLEAGAKDLVQRPGSATVAQPAHQFIRRRLIQAKAQGHMRLGQQIGQLCCGEPATRQGQKAPKGAQERMACRKRSIRNAIGGVAPGRRVARPFLA